MEQAMDQVRNPKKTIGQMWSYLKRDKIKLIFVIVMVILSTIASVLGPLLMGIAIDDFIGKENKTGLIYLLACLLFLYCLHSLFTFLTNFVMARISETSLYRIRKDIFEHLEKLPLSYFDQHKKGDIMSRFTNDISMIDEALSDTVIDIINSVITLVGVTIIMFVINPILALTTIITVPFFFVLVMKIGQKAGEYFTKQQEQLGNLNGYAEEMISGMKIIKSFVQEKRIVSSFEQESKNLTNLSVKAQLYSSLIMPANVLITNIGHILLIGVGAFLVVKGQTTIGSILAFLNYSNMFRRPINQLASLYASIQAALAGAERVFSILDEKIEQEPIDENVILEEIKGDVVLKDVTFSYQKGKEILKHIDIHAKAGDMIALVGPTGAGKTTIINLLTRFYDIDSGEILIDSMDIKNIKKEELRKRIGIVLQDTYLFKGTVKDNIGYGKLDASEEEIIEASKKAQAHSFIHRLPDGYDSFVEEEGSNFSQGQRQLIAIARAILANPEILILDEATSSVDTKTESAIQNGMKELMKDRTSFVIAHRLSTIKEADEIIVLNDGEIVERGNHTELLDKKGFYYELYMSQFDES